MNDALVTLCLTNLVLAVYACILGIRNNDLLQDLIDLLDAGDEASAATKETSK